LTTLKQKQFKGENPTTKKPVKIIIIVVFTAVLSSLITYFFFTSSGSIASLFTFWNTSGSAHFLNHEKTSEIQLTFLNPDNNEFVSEARKVDITNSKVENIKIVVQELINGSKTKLISAIPDGVNLLNLFLDKENNLYLDFNSMLQDNHPCGTESEFETIYCLFHTIFTNYGDINNIRILIEGKSVDTLCGHLDLKATLDSILKISIEKNCSEIFPPASTDEINETNQTTTFESIPSQTDSLEEQKSTTQEQKDIPLYVPDDQKDDQVEEKKID
jgi:hypothetical protein